MSKYKIGDQLLTVKDPNKETQRLRDQTFLKMDDKFSTLSWGIKIVEVEYDNPNVALTYINALGEVNKVFACCKDIENFDKELVLEKALLKAFQNEVMNITVIKNGNLESR